MKTLLKNIFKPQRKLFYNLFNDICDKLNVLIIHSEEFVNCEDFAKRVKILNKITTLESEIDGLTHKIFIELSQNYITPFDREDIYGLTKSLKYIAEYLRIVSVKIEFYKINPAENGVVVYSKSTFETIELVTGAVLGLRNLKNTKELVKNLVHINESIHNSNDIFLHCIEKVFDENEDLKKVIKTREILLLIESINNQLKECNQFLESIIIKYS